MRVLSQEDIEQFLDGARHWRFDSSKQELFRQYELKDFAQALEAANRLGEIFERLNHHPDVTIGWGKLVVRTHTHDAGNVITQKDVDVAEAIELALQ